MDGSDTNLSELVSALVAAQLEFPSIKRERNVTVRTKEGKTYKYAYADLEDILSAVRPALGKHGLGITQSLLPGDGANEAMLQTRLMHVSGAWLQSVMAILITPDDPQRTGSRLTYARRYALTALLGIATEDDNDAQHAGPSSSPQPSSPQPSSPSSAPPSSPAAQTPATDKQLALLVKLAQEMGWDEDERRRRAGVESFKELSKLGASRLIEAWTSLRSAGPRSDFPSDYEGPPED